MSAVQTFVSPYASAELRGFFRARRILLLGIVLFGMALRFCWLNPGLARSPDERTFNRQANILLALGTRGLTILGQQLASDPARFAQQPSPARVGYLAVLAGFMRLTDNRSIIAGALLSLLCSLIALLLFAFIADRTLAPTAAIPATLLYAASPFDLATARRAWQDEFIVLFALVVLALALGVARSHGTRRIVLLVAFALAGGLAITTKENFGFYYLLCATGLTLHLFFAGKRRNALETGFSAMAGVAAGVAVQAWIFGGLVQFLAMESAFTHYSALSPYDLQYDTGTAWMFAAALLCACPLVMLAVVAGTAQAVRSAMTARVTPQRGFRLGLALLVVLTLLLQIVMQRYNFRFCAPIYGALCLLAGVGLEAVRPMLQRGLAPLGKPAAWAILGFTLGVGALHDLNFAHDRTLRPGMQDLALRPVLGSSPAPLPAKLP